MIISRLLLSWSIMGVMSKLLFLIVTGDPIAPGDILCDIQTDKAVVSFEYEEEGILAKILVRTDMAVKYFREFYRQLLKYPKIMYES